MFHKQNKDKIISQPKPKFKSMSDSGNFFNKQTLKEIMNLQSQKMYT